MQNSGKVIIDIVYWIGYTIDHDKEILSQRFKLFGCITRKNYLFVLKNIVIVDVKVWQQSVYRNVKTVFKYFKCIFGEACLYICLNNLWHYTSGIVKAFVDNMVD